MRWILSALFFLAIASPSFAQEFNAGFVQGLWYADDVLFANNPTRIYVAIRNNTGADLTGTVEFYDNDMRIERNNVSALDGRIIESWTDWTPSYGEHTITATISRIELHKVGSSTRAVEVVSASTTDSFFIDYDIDNDGVGNKQDKDDDGDGIEDEKEISNGTDPLDASDPGTESQPEDNESSDSDTEENKDSEDDNSSSDDTNLENNPQGLEKYVDEGQGNSILSSFTESINNTKKRLDEYREERNNRTSIEQTTTEATIVQEDNTDITSTTSSNLSSPISLSSPSYKMIVFDSPSVETKSTSSEDKISSEGKSVFSSIFDFAKGLSSGIYTLLLFLFSVYLANPAVVQITLLILILLLLYKVLKRLGSRSNRG